MKLDFFPWRSLKTRVTLFTVAIFLISIWTLAFYVSQKLHVDMQKLLGKQQFATVTVKADEVNRELGDHLSALGRIASSLTPSLLSQPDTLLAFLEERPVLFNQFSGGVIVVGLGGAVLAEAPLQAQRSGANYLTIDCVAGAIKEGRSTIGKPFLDKSLNTAVFCISVPVRDTQGVVIGALVGITILNQSNFLDHITESYFGKSGYFVLVEPETRMIITATGHVRIMEKLSTPGSNWLFDRFISGNDESGVTQDSPAVEVLVSAKRIPVANWFIMAAMPTDEAFVLILDMKRYMLEATLFLTVLAGSLTWWMIRRELAPMLSAAKTLATLSDTPHSLQPLPIADHDEIGELIGGFNRLLEVLGQREAELRESETRFKALHNASFGGIAIIDNGIILDCNQGLSKLTGYSTEELVGMDGILLIAPEWQATVMQNIRDQFEQPYDAEGIHKDGTRFHVGIRGQSIPYKGRMVRVTELLDITERKRMEEQARQLAFHDSLTKLPNRRLLNDRLRQTMSASKRNGCYGALMFLDLDNFKPLNDTHGHGVGDLLLIEVANRLRASVRETDTVARFGGDEFVVMLGDLSASHAESVIQAQTVAEKIRLILSTSYRLPIAQPGKADTFVEHYCTVSIGVTLFINNNTSGDDIIKGADTAMYQAKESGRNAVRFFTSPA